MPTAVETARYLIHLASREREPVWLTHLQLEKLLYYVQAWTLVARRKPFFDDRIEAWKYGPVVPSVYQILKPFEKNPIPHTEGEDGSRLNQEERSIIRSVWEGYKAYSPLGLAIKTHDERPWAETFRPDSDGRCSNEIPLELMRTFFEGKYRQHQRPGFELETLRRAEEELQLGRVVPFESAFS